MKWITRSDAKVDRIACPWLIRTFIDPDAEFLFVPESQLLASAEREHAIPFDAPKLAAVKLNHRGERCTFEAIIEDYRLNEPGLQRLALIVRAADIKGQEQVAPEGIGPRIDDDDLHLAVRVQGQGQIQAVISAGLHANPHSPWPFSILAIWARLIVRAHLKNATNYNLFPMRSLMRLFWLLALTLPFAHQLCAAKNSPNKSVRRPRIFTLMYLVNRPASIESFRRNIEQVSIIAPQCFTMDAEGFVSGEVPSQVLEIAREGKVALMPLVTNRGFNQDLMHTVLDTPASRSRVIRYLLYYALRDGHIGFQFDFENIKYMYRDRFTVFFREAAREFHRHHLLLSAAVVGKHSDDRNSESPGGFENWSGVYDYRALAKDADFLSVMAYPQHAGFSGPGPLAGLPWVTKIVNFTLANMPANKVSLGVAVYGIRWTAVAPGSGGTAAFVQDNEGDKQKKWKTSTASWPDVIPELRKTYQPKWDESEQAHWLDLTQNGATSIAWYEDAQSLAPKLKLAVDRKLKWGISAWVLGQEDPEFWTMLKENYRVVHPQTLKLTGTANQRAFAAARRMHVDKRTESNTAQGK